MVHLFLSLQKMSTVDWCLDTLNGWGRSLERRLPTTESVIPLAWSSWLQKCLRTTDWPLTFDGPIKIWCNFWPEENTHYVREWRKWCPLISYYEDEGARQKTISIKLWIKQKGAKNSEMHIHKRQKICCSLHPKHDWIH